MEYFPSGRESSVMLRKWLLAPAVGLVMALCILGGTVAGTGVKATASIFDKFYETYWQEDGPEDGNLEEVEDEFVPL